MIASFDKDFTFFHFSAPRVSLVLKHPSKKQIRRLTCREIREIPTNNTPFLDRSPSFDRKMRNDEYGEKFLFFILTHFTAFFNSFS